MNKDSYHKEDVSKEKKPLPIGISDYIRAQAEYYYVDKTKMIEELIINRSKVSLFPRPRRFGKTLMLSTIDEFFNIEKAKENEKLFELIELVNCATNSTDISLIVEKGLDYTEQLRD